MGTTMSHQRIRYEELVDETGKCSIVDHILNYAKSSSSPNNSILTHI